MFNLDDLEDFFDEQIPQEVLDSDDWTPTLLPDLDSLGKVDYTFNDMTEDNE